MTIRLLPETLVNRIAAGEVVERPASAVKELVENAIDAGARRIDITMIDGGRSRMVVSDDGCGMDRDELGLAVTRHATSKLPDDDLLHIHTLGFRGEALPSIGAVSRLSIASRARGADEAWSIEVTGGAVDEPKPVAQAVGTRIEVRDLFFATPARLKFLKQPRTEYHYAVDVVQRLAMAHPEIAFSLGDGQRQAIHVQGDQGDLFEARLGRLGAIMGREFADNAVALDASRDDFRLTGYVGLPTLNRATGEKQYLFVNNRPVRDKLLLGALRGAYRDVLASDRYPLVALFLEVDPEWVDVNVHPAKTEVRFRDPGLVRGLIVGGIKQALASAGHRTATTVSQAALGAVRPQGGSGGGNWGARYQAPPTPSARLREQNLTYHAPLEGLNVLPSARQEDSTGSETAEHASTTAAEFPLGVARGQVHGTYIVAQTADGIVVVDQHAAHERIVQERMAAALAGEGVKRQGLLIPEVVELDEAAAGRLAERAEELAELGLVLEPFGPGAITVREIPALLGKTDVKGLVRDIADQLAETGEAVALKERLNTVCATLACHGSVRAGRVLSGDEMNALLRQMETMPNSGQCSHGRPTYVELKLADIERLFGRR